MKLKILLLLLLLLLGLAVVEAQVNWPDFGSPDVTTGWIPYTRLGDGIKDKSGNPDQSNGGTTPQGYVDVIGNEIGQVSVFYSYDSTKQTLFVRMRMDISTLTNSPDGSSNDDPFNSGTWCLLIDSDSDGWKEFVAMLDGQSGSPSSPRDEVVVYYENTNTQSLSSATKTFSQKMQFPDKDARAVVYDYGWGRVIELESGPSGDCYLDWQIPLTAFTVTGNQLITENTHISFGYSTANSNTNPLQKDVIFNGNFTGDVIKQFPFGDQLTLKDGITQAPFSQIISITGCAPTTIDAKVLDILNVNESGAGSITTSIAKVDFFYRKQSGGSNMLIGTKTVPLDALVDIGLYRMVWNNATVAKDLYYVWCEATDLQGNIGISELLSYNHICGPVGVSVSGTVYKDANHNSNQDAGESGTGLALYAKIFLTSSPTGPATQAVAVNTTTGAYSFAAIAEGSYYIVIDNNDLVADVTPTLPAGWIGTEYASLIRTITVKSQALTKQNFGLYNGSKITSKVFSDTGVGTGGIPNDAIQNGSELGIPNVFIRATNADGSITYDSTLTENDGSYVLWLPSTATIVKVIESNMPNSISIGGTVGNTGGTYNRNTDTTEFTAVAGTVYSNVNFADVPMNNFSADQQRTVLPGTIVLYPHTFISGTGGQVVFTTSNLASPNITGWNQALYQDINCNGAIDAGEPVLFSSTAINTTAGQKICVILKEFVPTNAPTLARNAVLITPTFTYTNASPVLADTTLINTDVTIVNPSQGHLRLIKSVNPPNGQPGDTLTYTVNYINVGTTYVKEVVLSDPISPYFTFVLGEFPGGKDILWQKPDGTTVYLSAAIDGDEGSMEGTTLYVRMGTLLQVPVGTSGMIQYFVKIK